MKKLLTALVTCTFLFPSLPTSKASDSYHVPLGSHFMIEFPQEDLISAKAQFHEKTWPFFSVEEEPAEDQMMTRAEFIWLLYQVQDFSPNTSTPENPFPDLAEDHFARAEVIDASTRDIIHGYTNGNFGPYDSLTRAQAAKILNNSFDISSLNKASFSYPDLNSEHDLYEDMTTAITAGMFKGYPDGLMRPDRAIRFDEAQTLLRRLSKKNAPSLPERAVLRAYIGVHRLWQPKQEQLIITSTDENGQTRTETKTVDILPRDFETVSFSLVEEKEALLDAEYQDTTWDQINAAKSTPFPTQLWDGVFIMPTQGVPTLGFGDKLYINGKYSGSHFGHDWANEEGTEILASNTGIVTLAEWTQSYGYTIVIDHGHNVFTMYLHLSRLFVEKGNSVSKGQLIGEMGSTGVATGSHLHFTHFIGDVIVDSEEWLEREQ